MDYFNAFLNSVEGNNSTRLEILICIITRMCFYDSENMQKRFKEYVYDQDFFPNLNKLIRKIFLHINMLKEYRILRNY